MDWKHGCGDIELLDKARLLTKLEPHNPYLDLIRLGFETLPGEHPVVPLLLRDTARTTALVAHLRRNYILATGLNYPVVPKGDEEIRFQIGADHTPHDIDTALDALGHFVG